MKLDNFYCSKCGSEVLVTYEPPSYYFKIKNGNLTNLADKYTSCGIINFVCSNDKTHIICPNPDSRIFKLFEEWVSSIEKTIDNMISKGELL